MKLGLLHISDLHKEVGAELTNRALLNSLERDRERYCAGKLAMSAPSIIIVSGESDPRGSARSSKCQRRAEATILMSRILLDLCETFTGGDRSRIVLIPGNHDVDYHDNAEHARNIGRLRWWRSRCIDQAIVCNELATTMGLAIIMFI